MSRCFADYYALRWIFNIILHIAPTKEIDSPHATIDQKEILAFMDLLGRSMVHFQWSEFDSQEISKISFQAKLRLLGIEIFVRSE